MKKIIIFICVFFFLLSCKKQKFDLNGQWKVIMVNYKVHDKKEYEKHLKEYNLKNKTELTYEINSSVLKLEEGTLYNFKSNDSIIINFPNDLYNENKVIKGKYKLTDDKKNLFIGDHKFIIEINNHNSITLKKASLTNPNDTLIKSLLKPLKITRF